MDLVSAEVKSRALMKPDCCLDEKGKSTPAVLAAEAIDRVSTKTTRVFQPPTASPDAEHTDVAQRLIDLASGELADELTWASYRTGK